MAEPTPPAGGTGRPHGLPLQRGDSGEAVYDLQRRLALIGYSPDGNPQEFGSETEAALRRFQSDRGLVVDGICGPQSWNAWWKPTTVSVIGCCITALR